MSSSTVHILTFDTSDSIISNNLTISPDQDTLGTWMGECLEDPSLTLVVIVGFQDRLDPQSFFGFTPKEQRRTEMSTSSLLECLNAPVTEVASTVLKAGCDDIQAASLIDAAMQTVLDADDCVAAVWKTSAKEATFFVGWNFLEAHEKYHQTIFANPPECIKQLPNIVDTNVVLHVAFRPIQSVMNKMS